MYLEELDDHLHEGKGTLKQENNKQEATKDISEMAGINIQKFGSSN